MFYWKVVKIESKEMHISFHFVNPKNVSQSKLGWDIMEVVILNQ